MKNIQFIVWLLPILFMFHDFEEIIFMKPWVTKSKYSKLSTLSASALALGIAEEFVIISIVTIVAFLTGWYYLWLGLFIGFTAHLIFHCMEGLVFKGYLLITSIICLPPSCYFIVLFWQLYKPDIKQVIIFSIVGIVAMLVNLIVIHKIMLTFDKWLNKYQNN